MKASACQSGCILSHTMVRVAGKAHADETPFPLLLVKLTDGSRVLGRFAGPVLPAIGSQVTFTASADETPVFEKVPEEP